MSQFAHHSACSALRDKFPWNTPAFGTALLLALSGAGAAPAGAAVMPAGADVWMVHQSNACWDHVTAGGSTLCAASDQFGVAGGLPMQSYYYPSSSTAVTSFAQAFPDSVHTYLAGYNAGFVFVSMHDTYTVHGAAPGSFAITAHLAAAGVANSIWIIDKYILYRPYATVEIGTFNPSTADLLEGSRITPFYDGTPSATTATWEYGITSGSAVSVPFSVSTSYTKTVQSGDIFELGYGVNTTLTFGELDLRNTAVISFDLPDGVWLTSQNGAVFGTPVPEPKTWALMLAGFGLVGAIAHRKARLTRA